MKQNKLDNRSVSVETSLQEAIILIFEKQISMKTLAFVLLAVLGTGIDAYGKPCFFYPQIPQNSKRSCKYETCTLTCTPQFYFPDGSTDATLKCNDGKWIPNNKKWIEVPNCEKLCTLPCINGGTCLARDFCQCPKKYRGQQCQHKADVCAGEKLEFNGNYQCRGDSDSFKCSVTCPENFKFYEVPKTTYICKYDTGLFDSIPPKCNYGNNNDTITATHEKRIDVSVINVDRMHNGKQISITVPEYIEIENLEVIKLRSLVCFLWGDGNIITFDGRIYSASIDCEEILVNDVGGSWSIVTNKSPNNNYRSISIIIGNQEYAISKSDNGQIMVLHGSKQHLIPIELNNIKISNINKSVVIQLKYLDVIVRWDMENLVQVEISETLISNTRGLCGVSDGNEDNDLYKKDGKEAKSLTDFLGSWSTDESCKNIKEEHACNGLGDVETNAQTFCLKLLSNPNLQNCISLLELPTLINACIWDYCKCKEQEQCACVTLDIVNRNCLFNEKTKHSVWRDPDLCPLKCTDSKVYMPCQPEGGQPTCKLPGKPNNSDICFDGCYCPVGTNLHNDKCIPKAKCPCIWLGQEYASGSTVPEDCNTCTCIDAKWSCTKKDCRAECNIIGDPHITTFDGKYYDFMGQCNYYLLKMGSITVEGVNALWPNSNTLTFTKSVIIKISNQKIILNQNKVVEANGAIIKTLPAYVQGATITTYSSSTVSVLLYNGVEILWNGVNRVQIYVGTKHKGLTSGLCGTYNKNQADDFRTPAYTIEKDPTTFGNSWITGERCKHIATIPDNSCKKASNKAFAEEHCKTLKSNLFSPCHAVEDVVPHYENCLYDMCTCAPNTKCMCPMLATYATLCSNKGINIDWVKQVQQCSEKCDSGQIFQSCSNPCTRTCSDIANGNCKEKCVEGCSCPGGQTLDENNKCIPISKCKCKHNGLEFSAGYKESRIVEQTPSICHCVNAVWKCQSATKEELKQYPESKGKCDMANNFVFTNCKPVEPITCLNMLDNDEIIISKGKCKEGCQCKDGYVLNNPGTKCIDPLDCICDGSGIKDCPTISRSMIKQIFKILYPGGHGQVNVF